MIAYPTVNLPDEAKATNPPDIRRGWRTIFPDERGRGSSK
jgi:hypothetical protein